MKKDAPFLLSSLITALVLFIYYTSIYEENSLYNKEHMPNVNNGIRLINRIRHVGFLYFNSQNA